MGKRVYCEAEADRTSGTLICSKEKGHDHPAKSADTRVHYDATADKHFDYPGQIVITIEIPGKADVLIAEDVPDNYGAMDDSARRNHLGYAEERYRELMNVYARYIAPGEEI
jgi:hypothetical protein